MGCYTEADTDYCDVLAVLGVNIPSLYPLAVRNVYVSLSDTDRSVSPLHSLSIMNTGGYSLQSTGVSNK